MPDPMSNAASAVYKGCTPDAPGTHKGLFLVHPVSIPCAPLVHDAGMPLARLGMVGIRGWASNLPQKTPPKPGQTY